MKKLFDVQNLLWLALVLALAGSLKHLAAIFAGIDGNIPMGWLQAVAIDAGLFALAYSIKARKVAKRSVKPLWFGVTLFTGISIYGNLAYGLLATGGNLPGWIAASRPYVLAASLPVLVLFLSELLSDDRQHAAKIAELEAKQAARQTAKDEQFNQIATQDTTTLDNANAARQAAKQANLATLAGLLATQPDASNTELATRLAVSRGTIRNYRHALQQAAHVAANGNGNGNGNGIKA
jgi:hypothetical protein